MDCEICKEKIFLNDVTPAGSDLVSVSSKCKCRYGIEVTGTDMVKVVDFLIQKIKDRNCEIQQRRFTEYLIAI